MSVALVIGLVIAAAAAGLLVLPMRKQWNADGSDDERRSRDEEE